MFRSKFVSLTASGFRRFCFGLLAVALCVGLSGCTSLNLCGSSGDCCNGFCSPEPPSNFFGASNKAREIERNVGIE